MDKKQIEWVNGLKGVCSMMVVMLHLLACFFSEILGARTYVFSEKIYNFISLTPINIFFNGSFAVYIFGILSAFLITISWNQLKSTEDLTRKILNKYFRILFPVVLCSTIAFMLICCGLYYNIEAGRLLENSFFINERDYSNVSIMILLKDIIWNDFFGGSSVLIPPLWTMKIEFIGCLMTSSILILLNNLKYRKLILIIISVICIKASVVYICFVAGIVLADYYQNKRITSNFMSIVTIGAGIILGAYPPSGIPESGIYYWVYKIFINSWDELLQQSTGVHAIYVLAAALIIYGIIINNTIQDFFENKLLVWLGKRSLYTYIVHIPVIWSAVAYIFVKIYAFTANYMYSIMISWILGIFLIILISTILKYISERVFLPVSGKIVNRLMTIMPQDN